MHDVSRKMAAGAAWMVLFKFAERSLGFISTLILARLLVPADFGVVAMATSFVAMLELLSAFGFDVALIRRRDTSRPHYDTAWTFNVIVGAVVAVAMVAAGGAIATFYRAPDLRAVLYVLALGSLAQGFENVGVVAFRKEMDFRREFRFQLAKKLVMFAVIVPLGFALRSYWAMVAGIVASRIASVGLSYWVHPYRPRFSLAAWSDLLHFSKWLLLNNVLGFMRERTSDIVIGRLRGPRDLGLYNVGYEIANLPTTELVMPINRAVYPGYARMSADLPVLRQGFVSVIGIIALFAVPAGAGIAATAQLIAPVLLGAKWAETVPLIEILAFFGVTMALQTNSYSVYLAIGRPQLQALMSMLFMLVLAPAMYFLTARSGAIGAAQACVLAGVVVLPVNYAVALSRLELGPWSVLQFLWRPMAAAAAMYWLVVEFLERAGETENTLAALGVLLAAVLIGSVSYFALVLSLWVLAGRPSGAEALVIARLRQALPGSRATGDA